MKSYSIDFVKRVMREYPHHHELEKALLAKKHSKVGFLLNQFRFHITAEEVINLFNQDKEYEIMQQALTFKRREKIYMEWQQIRCGQSFFFKLGLTRH